MQTTTYGTTQPKSKTLSTSAYSAPTAPLSALYGGAGPYVSSPGLTPANAAKFTSAAQSIIGSAPYKAPASSSPIIVSPNDTKSGPGSGPSGVDASGNLLASGSSGIVPPNVNDLTSDPVYQKVVAAGQQNIGDANVGALAQAKNAIIGYGALAPDAATNLQSLFQQDPNNPILGALSDTLTAQAAKNNPNAVLNQLAQNDVQRVGQLNSDLNNNGNLFYSSTRAAQLANDANTYRGEQAQATTDLADALSQIYGNVLNTRQQALMDQNNALEQAYQNALNLAALGGGAPAGQTGPGTNGPAGPTSVNTGGGNTTGAAIAPLSWIYRQPGVAAI